MTKASESSLKLCSLDRERVAIWPGRVTGRQYSKGPRLTCSLVCSFILQSSVRCWLGTTAPVSVCCRDIRAGDVRFAASKASAGSADVELMRLSRGDEGAWTWR